MSADYTQLLFIDQTVPDFSTFVSSANSQTLPIVYSANTTKATINRIIEEHNIQSLERIGFVFVSSGPGSAIFVDHLPFFDEGDNISNDNVDYVIQLIQQYQIKHVQAYKILNDTCISCVSR